MRQSVTSALLTGAIVVGLCAGSMSRPARAATNRQAAGQTDHSFTNALAKGNKQAVGRFLDPGFEWTNNEGRTRNRPEALESLAALGADTKGDAGIQSYSYQGLTIFFGRHGNSWFSRIWVKRPSGWKLFTDMDTPLASKRYRVPQSRKPGPIGNCVNPCRTIPYTPTTAADKAVIAEWQEAKMDEWHPNIKDWGTHVAREFLIINSYYGSINKRQRVAIGVQRQKEGIGIPGDPILSIHMYDFADTVVTISRHRPYHGGKPYYNLRVFVHRNGHWLIAWSQQTKIQSAAPLPPVS